MKKILILFSLLFCLTACTTSISIDGRGKLVIMDTELRVYEYHVQKTSTQKNVILTVQFLNESDFAKKISISEVKAFNKKTDKQVSIKAEIDEEFGDYIYYSEYAYYDLYISVDINENLNDYQVTFDYAKFTVKIDLEEK